MNIRAKVRCESVMKFASGGEQVKLLAVQSGSEENKSFAQFTPSLEHTMQITNPDAVGKFEPGKEYYLDFSPAN